MEKFVTVKAWWQETGTDVCPGCRQLYVYEVGYRCADCDGPQCHDCVKESESLTMVCSDCIEPHSEKDEVS